jgi:hypothetical protein
MDAASRADVWAGSIAERFADRPPTDPEDLVFEVELQASRRDPYRQLSRLFHLLGRRRDGGS